MTDEEREFFKKQFPTTTILPGDSAPTSGWHVCPLERTTPEDKVSNCTICDRPVYFLCDWPHLDKICATCAKKKGDMPSFTTETALAKFLLHGKHNCPMNKHLLSLSVQLALFALLALLNWSHILLERNQREIIQLQVTQITLLQARLDHLQKVYVTTKTPKP